MKKFFNLIILLVLLPSCVSTQVIKLSSDEANNFRGKTIAIVSRDKPDMLLHTPFDVALLGGLFVYGHMLYSGNKIVKENSIDDPFLLTAEKLQSDLAKSYNLKIINDAPSKKVSTYDVNKIANLYRGIADYVIDVRSLNWRLGYVSRDISYYAVVYSSQLKLIDVNTSKVIAEHSCQFTPYNSYPKSSILADNAKLLKKDLLGAADACAKFFKDTIL